MRCALRATSQMAAGFFAFYPGLKPWAIASHPSRLRYASTRHDGVLIQRLRRIFGGYFQEEGDGGFGPFVKEKTGLLAPKIVFVQ